MSSFEALFREIQGQADKSTWSSAVSLSRTSPVQFEQILSSIEGIVVDQKKSFHPRLGLEDQDWSCDCDTDEDPCLHVMVTSIWVKNKVTVASTLRLQYRFLSDGQQLRLRRVLTRDHQQEEALTTSVRRCSGYAPSAFDIEIEEASMFSVSDILDARCSQALAKIMERHEGITLDGDPIAIHAQPSGWYLDARQENSRFHIELKSEKDAFFFFQNGWVLKADGLYPQKDQQRLQRLIPNRSLNASEWAEFQAVHGSEFPQLQESLQIVPPRLIIETRGSLQVRGKIVYGDPVIAELSDRWIMTLPVKRQLTKEEQLRHEYEDQFSLRFGEWHSLAAESAVECVKKVQALDRSVHGKAELEGDAWKAFVLRGELEFLGEQGFGCEGEIFGIGDVLASQDFLRTDRGWFRIPSGWVAQHRNSLQLLHRGDAIGKSLAKKALGIEVGESRGQHAWKTYALNATLRPYQEEGILWLRQRLEGSGGAILADDMGLGKTLQSMALIPSGAKTIVACPMSLLENWRSELRKFRSDLRVAIYHGAERRIDTQADVIITSHGLLRSDLERLKSDPWQLLIVDEAHMAKNSESLLHRALVQFPSVAKLLLSGTPIENSAEDLRSLLRVISRSFETIQVRSDEGRKLLSMAARDLVLRRRKADVVMDLPPRLESIVRLKGDDEQLAIYKDLAVQARGETSQNPLQILAWLTRLRMAACDPRLVSQESGRGAKVDYLVSRLRTLREAGHKALVFSQWTSFLDLIQQELGDDVLRIDGQTEHRQMIVDRFQNDPSVSCMLMSLKAGGVGLNLTAADHVFIMDPWWNPAAEAQAADRSHRIGQQNPVHIYKLVTEDTIEEKVIVLQAEKMEMAEEILNEEGPRLIDWARQLIQEPSRTTPL